METKKQTSDWPFWGAWALAFIGFPLGGVAASALVGPVTTPVAGALAGIVTGAVVGATQWLVLRRRLQLSPWWAGATAAGMAAGLGLGTTLLGTETAGVIPPLRGLITGAGIGLAQFVVLRENTDKAAAWAPLVAIGWALGWIITRAAGVDLGLQWSVFGSTGAWMFQFLTGLTLVWLLQQRTHDLVVA